MCHRDESPGCCEPAKGSFCEPAVPGTGQRTLPTFSVPARDSASRGKGRMRMLGQGELIAKGIQHSRLMCYMESFSSKSGKFYLLRKL